MPHLDGLSLTQQIRQIPEYRAVPIIILSRAEPNEAVYQTYVRGGNAFLAKPFTYKELKILVYHLGKYWLEMGQLPHRYKAP
jgi:two-component system, response regulator